jgi:hypothetical protein
MTKELQYNPISEDAQLADAVVTRLHKLQRLLKAGLIDTRTQEFMHLVTLMSKLDRQLTNAEALYAPPQRRRRSGY